MLTCCDEPAVSHAVWSTHRKHATGHDVGCDPYIRAILEHSAGRRPIQKWRTIPPVISTSTTFFFGNNFKFTQEPLRKSSAESSDVPFPRFPLCDCLSPGYPCQSSEIESSTVLLSGSQEAWLKGQIQLTAFCCCCCCLYIKFYWNIATPIDLHVIFDHLYTIVSKDSTQPIEPEIFTTRSL